MRNMNGMKGADTINIAKIELPNVEEKFLGLGCK